MMRACAWAWAWAWAWVQGCGMGARCTVHVRAHDNMWLVLPSCMQLGVLCCARGVGDGPAWARSRPQKEPVPQGDAPLGKWCSEVKATAWRQ